MYTVAVQDGNLLKVQQWSDRAATEYANLFTKTSVNEPSGPSGQRMKYFYPPRLPLGVKFNGAHFYT